MLAVSIGLAAVLLTAKQGDDASAPPAAAVLDTPEAIASTVTPSVPTATPDAPSSPPISSDLQVRLDSLPEKLRTETSLAYSTGTLSLQQLEQIVTDYENRNPNLRVGSVISASSNVLRFEVFTTGEQVDVTTFEDTLVLRAGQPIALADLLPTELVMVVSTDEGAATLTIEAFGVTAP